MKYIQATEKHTKQITRLVQETITEIYPKYYPKEVVTFFLSLHCEENICKDIKQEKVWILLVNNVIVGTGSIDNNHITRVYVSPSFQRNGYGSYIMQQLENKILLSYSEVVLDASLPASILYEKWGYKTTKHCQLEIENGIKLVYEIMKKSINLPNTTIKYDGRIFTSKANSDNGEVGEKTEFYYHQNGNILWAEYTGGKIIKGNLIGTVSNDGILDFHYHHINVNGDIRIGKCKSLPRVLVNGKLELHEEWQWLNGDKTCGSSILFEV